MNRIQIAQADADGTPRCSAATSSFETEEVIMKLAKKNDIGVLSFDIHGVTRYVLHVQNAFSVY